MRWVALVMVFVGGCDYVERPRRPIPDYFRAESLAGEEIDANSLKGKPWVVNIWVPG